VKNVVERFPLQVVEKKTASKNKKRHWRDFLSGDGSVAHVSAMLVQEDEDLIQAKKLKGASLGGEGIDTKIKMDDIVAHKGNRSYQMNEDVVAREPASGVCVRACKNGACFRSGYGRFGNTC